MERRRRRRCGEAGRRSKTSTFKKKKVHWSTLTSEYYIYIYAYTQVREGGVGEEELTSSTVQLDARNGKRKRRMEE